MGIKENAIKQFGKQAEAYSKGNIFVDVFHLSKIVGRSGVKENHRILDVATGSGFLSLEFAKISKNVTGCDITHEMLIHAREKQVESGLTNIDFLLSDDLTNEHKDFVWLSLNRYKRDYPKKHHEPHHSPQVSS